MPEILRMPEVAANTTEAIVESWNVAVDQPYAAGEAIVTIETEKAVVDVEAEQPGVLLRFLAEAGATVAVGAPIAIWGTGGESADDVDALIASLGVQQQTQTEDTAAGTDDSAAPGRQADSGDQAAVAAQAAATPQISVAPPTPATVISPPAPGERLFASPLARRLARERNLDLSSITGTGPGGRIRRVDVEAVGAAPAPDVAPVEPARASGAAETDAGYRDVPNSRMRQAIARRLTESKQTVPHFYIRGAARVDELLALRARINQNGGPKISVNDLLIKAIARAHTKVPEMNVQWNQDSIRHFDHVDISVAVATDSGLVTPVLRTVETMSMSGVAAATSDLITRAKERKLQQDELEGGSISITNLGMFGTEDFAAIINPPQAAILAVGAARPEPVVQDDQVVVAQVLHVTLAVDHRPVDGATAAAWMKAFLAVVENPLEILL